MSILVQKFGGTSVADAAKILSAARRVIRARQAGHQVVVVVSARGQTTDELIALAHQICERPPARELDMLLATGEQVSVALMAMAVQSLGQQAISFTGGQIGILTDSTHTRARIRSIATERMRRALDDGKIVIAAGFQGIDPDGNITTLGRGGSDTTAVALAAVLGAEWCEIYTDVDGIYTTDPRLVPEARKLHVISADEMLELASLGAGVMHSRAVEFAKKFGVTIHVRSSFRDAPGTLIVPGPPSGDPPVVCGAARVHSEAGITMAGVPDRPGTSHLIFSRIAARSIPVDMIVQDVGSGGRATVSFTVLRDDLADTLAAAGDAARELGAERLGHDDRVSKVSVVGLGMRTRTGVAAQMFAALAEAGVNIRAIATSEIKISVLVRREDSQRALHAVHRAFGLDRPLPGEANATSRELTARASAGSSPLDARLSAAVVERLAGMEDLFVGEPILDAGQARVSVREIPDRPGIAAALFGEIAAGGIVVDLIVQNVSAQGTANLSFTVPRPDLERAVELARGVLKRLGGGHVASAAAIAKLSVPGVGLRSHTGVAERMFAALAAAGVNVEMISTSEVMVSAVVPADRGEDALEALRGAFAAHCSENDEPNSEN